MELSLILKAVRRGSRNELYYENQSVCRFTLKQVVFGRVMKETPALRTGNKIVVTKKSPVENHKQQR
jgi:hypothetical protein